MNYSDFCRILNRHLFEGEKAELLKRIAESPERFIGLFRPTKPATKILQNLLQSHEVRMGDALEEIIRCIIQDSGFRCLDTSIVDQDGNDLSLDQYFTDGTYYYLIEQKVRDDHDSSKKRGQLSNFELKLTTLLDRHDKFLRPIMYFIDPDFHKNEKYYRQEFSRLEDAYHLPIKLLYGKELFEFLGCPASWDSLMQWLSQWKDSLPDIPDINFDSNPQQSFAEIKTLKAPVWRKLVQNEALWQEGIMKAIFRTGETLRLVYIFFDKEAKSSCHALAPLLKQRIDQYYPL